MKNIQLLSFSIVLISILTASVTDQCTTNEDCAELNHCNLSTGKCVHNPVFPMGIKEAIGLIFILIGSALSNAGGIGGGGLLIPILLLLLGFYTHEAIPISKLMIFTGALTSFVLGFRQRHPSRNSISIDYNIPLLLVPLLLFGTMVGVTLNKVTPPWLILVSLTIVLVVNTTKTAQKARTLYAKENKERISMAEESDSSGHNKVSVPSNRIEMSNFKDSNSINPESPSYQKLENLDPNKTSEIIDGEMSVTQNTELLKIEEEKDLLKFPLDKLCYMILSYIFMLAISFLKGSEKFKSLVNIQVCSLEYWIVYASYFPVSFIVTYIVSNKIKKEYAFRKSIGYPYTSYDIKWDNNSVMVKFPIYAFISGVMAGLLGIGGGLILGPLLLELGLHPIVSTATSNFLVLFTSSSTSIQFILLGMMNLDYGIACTIMSSVGSFIGTILIQKMIQKTGRNSFIIMALALVLGVSTVLIPAHTFLKILDQIKSGQSIWTFNSPC